MTPPAPREDPWSGILSFEICVAACETGERWEEGDGVMRSKEGAAPNPRGVDVTCCSSDPYMGDECC